MNWNRLINILCGIAITIAVIAQYVEITNASSEWTKDTYKLYEKVQKLGMEKNLASYVINSCKETAINPRRCVITACMIAKAESNMWQNASGNNVWGINEWKKYDSVYANFDRWLKSYNKYWYKSPLPSHYYPPVGKVSKTNYCTDENSSWSKKGCPFGLKHATYAYNFLNK